MTKIEALSFLVIYLIWFGIMLYMINDLKTSVKNSIRSIRDSIDETRNFIKEK